MKKVFLLTVIILLVACNTRFGGKTTKVVDDGHNYQWILVGGGSYLVHSPECDTCRTIRKQETVAIIDSILKERQ